MELSKEQLKQFRRIHKKHPVTLEFLEYNFDNIIKELKFYTTFRFVIKRRLIQRKNRVFIKYNVPNKQILSKNKIRKRKNYRSTTHVPLTWSKKVVLYNKRLYLLDKVKAQTNEISNSDSQNDIELNLTPDEIQKQLKTQLELLKGGKRRFPTSSLATTQSSAAGTSTPKIFPSNSDITKRISLDRKSSFGFGGGGSSCSSFDISLKDAKEAGPSNLKRIHGDNLTDSSSSIDQFNDFLNRSKDTSMERNSTVIDFLNETNSNSKNLNDIIEPVKTQKKSFNFIDSLINKINSTKDKNPDRKSPNVYLKSPIINLEKNNKLSLSEEHEEDSLSSGEFLGFPDVEIIQPDVPGMLPTPVVPRKLSGTQSAFISEDLDKFMRDNLLDKKSEDDNTIDKIPKLKRRFEDGLVCKGAIPPKLTMASLPTELSKPRTLAEKRIMLQKNKNMKYLMIENENTIYHELKKRSRDCNVNISLIKSLQKQSIPATRDFWKATSWLLTENGKFYFQIANIDGIECKLIGGCGNNLNKNLPYQFSALIKKELKRLTTICPKNCKDHNSFKNIKIRYNNNNNNMNKENHKIHLVNNVKETINSYNKPGPLSSKCLHLSYMPNCGPPEIYRMPKIQLEVFPQINRPLDDVCKSYLKMILPSTNITKEWAEFAVSTLLIPSTKSSISDNLKDNELSTKISNNIYKSYTFNIPYLNDQKNILVRRVYNRKERFDKITTDDLQFRKIANKSKDPITLECANILSEMIDSVAIGLSEDSLIKNDPDIDYENKTKENANLKTAENKIITSNINNVNTEKKPPVDKKSNKKSGNPKSRLMLELRRLNATIIDAGGPGYEEEEICTKPYCRLGCVCTSLSGQASLKKHCKKPDCMIECVCLRSLIDPEDNNSCITSQDALMLRQKATARLARMEREFCSTVVLTNTETLLINESQYERKRRCTKRYSNYTYDSENEPSSIINKDDSLQQPPPNKRQRTTNKIKAIVTEAKLPPLDDMVYVNESIMQKLKHCQVNLTKLEYFENIEKWCMIHCLYKCFCKAKDLTGKPFILKKDEVTDKEEIIYSRKPIYSFDKNEEITLTSKTTPLKIITDDQYHDKIEKPKKSSGKLTMPSNNRTLLKQSKTLMITNDKHNEELSKERLLFRKYFEFSETNCRRVLQVPSTYHIRNRRYAVTKARSSRYHNFIENAKTKLLLSERIRNSELYKPTRTIFIPNSLKKFIPTTNNKNNSNNNNLTNENESQFLKISSVVSLNPSPLPTKAINSQNILQNPIMLLQQQQQQQTPTILTNNATDLLQTPPTDLKKIVIDCSIDSQDVHKNVLKLLNYLVTKTMHNICKIQVDESKNIPNPVSDTLHISQWRYFLQAYIEGIIHIWEVKVDNQIYFTGTMQNIMPFIRNAISVVNIKAIRKENLPLFGKMLNAKVINQQTSTLSILMAGHNDYWRILGMTKSTIDYLTQGGVIKPTPQSHPWLSTKINTLYEIMAKQRIDKILSKQKLSNNNNTNPNNNNNDEVKKNFIINVNNINQDNEIDRLLKSNIKIRQLTEREIIQDKFTIPVGLGLSSSTLDYRWFVLDIVDDFSHILFVEQMECLTHNKIKVAFQRSNEEKKMVRLAKVDGKNIDCYVMKNDKNRIYLGPFELSSNPQIVLYQNIDSKMMLREDFEKVHNIRRAISTTGFWLCRRNGKIIIDINKASTTTQPILMNSSVNDNSITNVEQPNLKNQENLRRSKSVETIIIDHDDVDEISDQTPSINNNSKSTTLNLQINEQHSVESNNLKVVEQKKNNSNENNLPTITPSANSSQKIQSIMINNKKPNNIILKTPTTNLNSNNNILKNTQIQKIVLNTSENNSNQSIVQSGLISLNPGVYEIKSSGNTSENKKSLIKTTNDCSLITKNNTSSTTPILSPRTSPVSSSTLCKPIEVVPIQIVKSVINKPFDKNINNNSLTKTVGEIMIGENINNNIRVAKKSTTSVLNNICSKNIPKFILPKSSSSSLVNTKSSTVTNQSNMKFINNIKLSSASSTVTTNDSKIVIDQSKQMKSFEINSTGFIPTDSMQPPTMTSVYSSVPNIPSFIKIKPISNQVNRLIPTSQKFVKSDNNFPKLTSQSNTKASQNLIKQPTSSNLKDNNKNTDVNLSNLNKGLINQYSQKNIDNVSKNSTSIVKTSTTYIPPSYNSNGDSLINTTADIKRPRTITGYFKSNINDYPKFGGMKRDPNYLIKSSSNSALQLKDLNEVRKFLNSHVRKHSPAYKTIYKNVSWSFVPYKKSKSSASMTITTVKQITTLDNVKTTQSVPGRGKDIINTNHEAKKTAAKNNSATVDNDVIVIDDED